MTLGRALLDFVTQPGELLVRRWNWKAAFSSSIVRAAIFFGANVTAGWRAAVSAMAAEYVFRAITSGFYGAMTQHFSQVEPEWQAAAGAMALLPVVSHSLEFTLHWLRHTPHLRASIVSSMSFTAVSTLFNFHAMRRGALVTGKGSSSFASDLRRMPRIIAEFVAVIPLWAWRSMRNPAA